MGKLPHRAVDAIVGVLFALGPAGMLRRRDEDHREERPADISFAMPGGGDQRPHLSGATLVNATTAQKSTFRQGQMLNGVRAPCCPVDRPGAGPATAPVAGRELGSLSLCEVVRAHLRSYRP